MTGKTVLVEAEIRTHDWSSLRDISGSAAQIPAAIRALVSATSLEVAERAYWQLENHVVVQGQLFDSACATTRVLMAALTSDPRPRFVKVAILELLFQILSGSSHPEEVARGNPDLADECQDAAREGLWGLYRELELGEVADSVKEVINLIEPRSTRMREVERLLTARTQSADQAKG